MWRTVLFTILTTPPLVILSLFFAADRARPRARWFFLWRFLPHLAVAVMALIWIWIYPRPLGCSLALAAIIAPPPATRRRELRDDVDRLATPVWWTLGFSFVLYLAGLQESPILRAAPIDGASPWQQSGRSPSAAVVRRRLSSCCRYQPG